MSKMGYVEQNLYQITKHEAPDRQNNDDFFLEYQNLHTVEHKNKKKLKK